MSPQQRSKATPEEVDRVILRLLASGSKTYYQLQRDTEARIQYALVRLENEGLIKAYSVRAWGAKRKRRAWGLTVKGFLEFLSQYRRSTRLILQAVEAYEDLLTYQVVAPEREDYVEPPRYVDMPLIPIRYQKIFRERLGDDTYVRCLTYPMLETDLPRYDVILERARSSFRRGHKPIQPEAKHQFIIEQEDLARAFTLRFLSNIFMDVFGDTSRAFRTPFPEKKAYDYLEALLTEEIKKLEEREERLTTILNRVLSFFNPDWKDPMRTV